MVHELVEGQIVLCMVEKIMGTTVFCKIGTDNEGTLITSEISPGRIRNLRDYVIPGKKIVCKVLSLKNGVHLSLRRVKQGERKELLDRLKKEKSYNAIIRTVLGKEESKKTLKEIDKDYYIIDFFETIKADPKILNKYFTIKEADKILKILETKKDKPKELKQILKLSSKSPTGINTVKEIIQKACEGTKCDVSYIAAGKYSLGIVGSDFKTIKTELHHVADKIEDLAKKHSCEFSIDKKIKS
ncbi:hypothetical protein GOV14_00365 [Candidatus Pacearchaeota archaeon]|nr:hypothetical protein [Candidatus Pacearchaeota archaeon]